MSCSFMLALHDMFFSLHHVVVIRDHCESDLDKVKFQNQTLEEREVYYRKAVQRRNNTIGMQRGELAQHHAVLEQMQKNNWI